MDEMTLHAYNSDLGNFISKYSTYTSSITEYLPEAFSSITGKILDIGCGIGRELVYLLSLGFDAWGTEPSIALRNEACKNYPQLCNRIFPYPLPFPNGAFKKEEFEGILCSAVYMHIPTYERQRAVEDLAFVLKSNGILVLSVSLHRPGLDCQNRDEFGRLFIEQPIEEIIASFNKAGFKLLKTFATLDALGRNGLTWQIATFCKQNS